uniref:Unkown protein n=1 Tax=Riptortus pedestris TaxID=329032 RepID=R4WE24_RIPPE|nr:unkown protein [Riptortus pedestris]
MQVLADALHATPCYKSVFGSTGNTLSRNTKPEKKLSYLFSMDFLANKKSSNN